LGVSNTIFSQTPAPQLISNGLKFVSVTPGLDFTCGLSTDHFAYCWGNNANGQLGDGTTESRSIPQRVLGGHQFTKVASGRHFTCGLTVNRSIYCWGSNVFGELGIGDPGNELSGASFRTKPVGLGGLK
jgi:alpha-tubulin suppressor-like RCC1 family protein